MGDALGMVGLDVMKYLWLILFFATLVWSAIDPKDVATWWLEVAPALVCVVVLAVTYGRFRLTTMAYVLLLAHCVVLMIGGHYTYAEVPLFDVIRDWMGSARNNYDKVGHFMQGFAPVIIAREIFIRHNVVKRGGWVEFLAVCFCLAVSAIYELIEWLAAVIGGGSAEAFLGTQGDVWDTQKDMAWALMGAIAGVLILRRWHDAQIDEMEKIERS